MSPPLDSVKAEFERASHYRAGQDMPELVISGGGTGLPGSDAALKALLDSTTYRLMPFGRSASPANFEIVPTASLGAEAATERLKRQFDELVGLYAKARSRISETASAVLVHR